MEHVTPVKQKAETHIRRTHDTPSYQKNVDLVSLDSHSARGHIQESPAEELFNILRLTKVLWMQRPEKSPMTLKTIKTTCHDPLAM